MKPVKEDNLKKVYVATFVDWNNYGSVLQAFAFKNTLLKIGYSSEILEAKNAPTHKSEFGRKVRSIREAFARLDFLLNRKEIKQRFRKNIEFINDNLNIQYISDYASDMYNLPENCVYISGSDQVWNPLLCHRLFFLDFPISTKRISYAASLGTLIVPKEKEHEFARLLNAFDYISVREKEAFKVIRKFTDKKLYSHIDPVFLLRENEWEEYESDYRIEEPYILVYAIYWDRKLNRMLYDLHKQSNREIVVIANDIQFIYGNRHLRNIGIGDFLSLFHHADAIVSSSFHGVAMALVYNKKLSAVINPQSPYRIKNLLDLFEYDNPQIGNVLDVDVDSIKNEKIITENIANSRSYLSKVIQASFDAIE